METNGIILIGYSGHAYVVADAILKANQDIKGYCEAAEKEYNPYELNYIGSESNENCRQILRNTSFIVGIGDNKIRERITDSLSFCRNIAIVIHPAAVIANKVSIGSGSVVLAGCVINPLSNIGCGVICNTGSIIEHEANIGDFSHIAPGAVLAGNVIIGKRSFVGAGATIKQGITIGDDVVIGAGAVVLRDVPSGAVIVGNPGRKI